MVRKIGKKITFLLIIAAIAFAFSAIFFVGTADKSVSAENITVNGTNYSVDRGGYTVYVKVSTGTKETVKVTGTYTITWDDNTTSSWTTDSFKSNKSYEHTFDASLKFPKSVTFKLSRGSSRNYTKNVRVYTSAKSSDIWKDKSDYGGLGTTSWSTNFSDNRQVSSLSAYPNNVTTIVNKGATSDAVFYAFDNYGVCGNTTSYSLTKTASGVSISGNKITANGNNIALGGSAVTVTASLGGKTVSLDRTFKRSTYNLTATSEDTAKGTVSGSATGVEWGASKTVTATPKTGWVFAGWYDGSTKVSSNSSYTFDMPTNNYTLTAKWEIAKYAVNIAISGTDSGSVSQTVINNVEHGTAVSVNGNILSIGGTQITATKNADTIQYSYHFDGFTNVPATITGATTITANFSKTVNEYTVYLSVNPDQVAWGSVESEIISGVPYGSEITVNGNALTVNGQTVAAIPTESGSQWSFAFAGWDNAPATVVGDTNVVANFSRELTVHTITFTANPDNYGVLSTGSINLVYGTVVTASGNALYVDGQVIVSATPSVSSEYTYSFVRWSDGETVTEFTVESSLTVFAIFSRTLNTYDITITVNDDTFGAVDTDLISSVPYGSEIYFENNILYVNGVEITATATTATAQYTYAFSEWQNGSVIVIGDTTVTAVFTRTVNTYDITVNVNDSSFGSVDTATIQGVPYGSAITVNGNMLYVGGAEITATAADATAQYTYSFIEWQSSALTVVGDTTVTAVFNRVLNSYDISIAVNEASYGSVNTTTIKGVPYGSEITVSQNKLYVGGVEIIATAASATAQYTYAFGDWQSEGFTVVGNTTVTAVFIRTVNSYTIIFNNYDGTELYSVSVEYGLTPEYQGSEPQKDADETFSYTFSGWTPEIAAVTEDAVYSANFDAILNAKASLSLTGDVKVNFYLLVSYYTDDENAYVNFTYNHENRGYDGERTTDVIAIKDLTPEKDGTYKFTCAFASAQICDLIDLELCDSLGNVLYSIESYSVKRFCEDAIAGGYSEELTALCKSIINYGGYSQIQFRYNTDNIANAGKDYASDIDAVKAEDIIAQKSIVENADGFALSGVITYMALEESAIRFYYGLDGYALSDMAITVSDGFAVRFGENGAGTFVEVYGIKASAFGNAFTVTVENTATGNKTTITYSVNDYVKDKLTSGASDNVLNLCKAIYLYGVASAVYFG